MYKGAGEHAAQFWEVAFIEDAATRRVTIVGPDGRAWHDNSNYDPCDTGIHLCGQTDDGKQPTTLAIYKLPAWKARIFYELSRCAACADEEGDFVVDLMQHGELVDGDFYSNRQLWPRAIEAWNEWEVAHLTATHVET